jgi:hypothetical protein
MEMEILGWEPEGKVSEAAGIIIAGRLLEMVVTPMPDGVDVDVVDGAEVVWNGVLPTLAAAKVEAIAQARRASFRGV